MLSSAGHQTLSYLQRRFAEAGVQPKARHGQNFLIDLNLLRVLVDTAKIGPNDIVLEVGSGTGSLTMQLAKQAAWVVTVEIDPDMRRMAEEQLSGCRNITLIPYDALKNKNTINPRVLDAIAEQLAVSPERRFKLAANLPYNIATPLITTLLDLERPPETMTVTIQKELADRMLAQPGTKDYGALSVWVQSQCDVEVARVLPPQSFWPRPKVTSAIITLTIRDDLRSAIPDRKFFHQFVRSMFFHRRKLLRGELLSATKGRLDKPGVDELLARMELLPTARAEELGVPQMLALCQAVQAAG
jgi:16S rRNA (adenine1518-N6/adenine1519-N6)-dimethyltransferase